MSHMLSSVSEDSTLGVIVVVLDGVAAETRADMVSRAALHVLHSKVDHVVLCSTIQTVKT